MTMDAVRITYGDSTVVMQWDGAQASAPIMVDGEATPYQTASARHRTALAVALVAAHVWPEVEWPDVPSVGSIPEEWADGCEAWDELAYAYAAEETTEEDGDAG